jgi:peptide/nickel transport system permease protein
VRNVDYVTAAIALGPPDRHIMFRHMLPNALAPVLVSMVLGIAAAILAESGRSFLGVGVPADTVTWGSILNEARGNTFAWWLVVFAGAAIFVAEISCYMVGEGLRDAFDPRLK